MTDLRIWSTLTPAEREQAIAQARVILDGGEKRWHVVARLCGIKGGIPLRTALDAGWRARKRALDAERYKREHGDRPPRNNLTKTERQQATSRERGLRKMTLRSHIAQHVPAPITLPKLKFMEETTSGL